MDWTQRLLAEVNNASDETLMLSRMDLHTQNIDCIVTRGYADGGLRRLYLAWEDHELWRNYPGTDKFSLGPHDHRGPVGIEAFHGRITRYAFEPAVHGEPLSEYRLSVTGLPRWLLCRRVRLRCVSAGLLSVAKLAALDIHTLHVPKGESAGWVVDEQPYGREETRLYSFEQPIGEMLSVPFLDADMVRERVERFCMAASKSWLNETVGVA